jgi:hypothetical protein
MKHHCWSPTHTQPPRARGPGQQAPHSPDQLHWFWVGEGAWVVAGRSAAGDVDVDADGGTHCQYQALLLRHVLPNRQHLPAHGASLQLPPQSPLMPPHCWYCCSGVQPPSPPAHAAVQPGGGSAGAGGQRRVARAAKQRAWHPRGGALRGAAKLQAGPAAGASRTCHSARRQLVLGAGLLKGRLGCNRQRRRRRGRRRRLRLQALPVPRVLPRAHAAGGTAPAGPLRVEAGAAALAAAAAALPVQLDHLRARAGCAQEPAAAGVSARQRLAGTCDQPGCGTGGAKLRRGRCWLAGCRSASARLAAGPPHLVQDAGPREASSS